MTSYETSSHSSTCTSQLSLHEPERLAIEGLSKGNVHLCAQCRAINFNAIIDHIASLGQAEAGDIVVQHRRGIDAECKLCRLLLRFVLPGTYVKAPEPYSDTPWQLRAFSIRCMLVESRTQNLFRPVPIALLHAGDGSRDFIKNNDSERVEKIGYLAFGRRVELEEATLREPNDDTNKHSTTRFVTERYDPEVVKSWLQYAIEADRTYYTDTSSSRSTSTCTVEADEISNTAFELIDGRLSGEESDSEGQCSDSAAQAVSDDEDEPVDIAGMLVIDCYTSEIISRTREMCYVTLSYVWKLAHEEMVPLNMQSNISSNPKSNRTLPPIVPKVVHNAIQVTMDLDYRYLWIDQFCIDQSAPEEKIEEHIAKMDLIYSLADFVIVAASSGGALPGVGSTLRTSPIHWNVIHPDEKFFTPEQDITIFNTAPPIHFEIQRQVWFNRGWCFQESVLSRRRLYFTDHQVFFESNDVHCCDSYPEPDDNVKLMLDADFVENPSLVWPKSWDDRLEQEGRQCDYGLQDPRGRFWIEMSILFQLLKVYTAKDLTCSSDSINGFAGALKVFSRNNRYFAAVMGLPLFNAARMQQNYPWRDFDDAHEDIRNFQTKCFCLALEWRHSDVPTRRPEFPSWSWAGWKGQAYWEDHYSRLCCLNSRLDITAIENTCGKISDLWKVIRLDQPQYLIGHGVIVPSSFFLWHYCWSRFSKETSMSSVVKWRARQLYSGTWRIHDCAADEKVMQRNLDDGKWACLLLNESLSEEGSVHEVMLLVVEWQNGELQRLHESPYRTCTRVGALNLFHHDAEDAQKGVSPFQSFPRIGFRLG